MKRMRAKDSHPIMKDLNQVIDLMDELGLRFVAANGNVHQAQIVSEKHGTWLMEDIEGMDHFIDEFPYATEFKLIKEEPE